MNAKLHHDGGRPVGRLPRVSVVMPSFNQAAFIEAAINSVLGQRCPDLELVVMDGGSTDGTLQILERLALQASGRMRWFSEADKGAADAINKAFGMARGAVIGWLNSDDLYAPDAVERALAYFDRYPGMMMVYGIGRHIDACGQDRGEYPTRRPPVELADFREGCFICQPTVFMRRGVLQEAGMLDESLATAFDFELWLRVFQRYADRIGFVDAVQAYSRLHGACITMRMRRLVALEGMKVTAAALGSASPNWFYTYLDEFFVDFPHVSEPSDARKYLDEAIDEARGYLARDDLDAFDARLRTDARLALVRSDAYVTVYPDGWAPPSCFLRVRMQQTRWHRVRLKCRYASPVPRELEVTVMGVDGTVAVAKAAATGTFWLSVELPQRDSIRAYWSCEIRSNGAFVPADVDSNSNDTRQLAFILDDIVLDA